MPVTRRATDLTERFGEHRDECTLPEYSETQVRREFIDPMFETLRWDTHNRSIAQRQIAATDEEIGRRVCEIYEPADEETAIVEESRTTKTTQESQ